MKPLSFKKMELNHKTYNPCQDECSSVDELLFNTYKVPSATCSVID